MSPSQSESISDYSVLAPGPVNLHPRIQQALGMPMIHHRTPEFDRILKDALTKLQRVFMTTQPVFILSSTGSGGMEALLVNTLNPGDKVLAIDSGKFGERWSEMAKTYGAKVIEHKVPWGEAVQPEDVRQILNQNPDVKIVLCQACETSTAVLHPIKELGEIIATSDALFFVDGIAALGALPLPMDDWKIDGLAGGSQKAFMLPTGLAFISFSAKAWNRIRDCKTPRFYFDVNKELAANKKGETFFSSNVTLIRALVVALDLIEKKGLSQHYAEIEARAKFIRHFASELGLKTFSKSPSSTVTALLTPEDVDSQQVRDRLEAQYRMTVMGGQDKLRGKILRIGHMGEITKAQQMSLINGLAETLHFFKPDFKARDLNSEMEKWSG